MFLSYVNKLHTGIFFLDKIHAKRISLNQVPKKHLKCIADRLPKQSSFRTLKTLTRYMLHAYNRFVGCSCAIKYPLWEKRDDGLCTVFLSARHSLWSVITFRTFQKIIDSFCEQL